jgi:hypothetical protein
MVVFSFASQVMGVVMAARIVHGAALAGSDFEFALSHAQTGERSPISFRVEVDGVGIYAGKCPDPPCHQMITLPHAAGGAEMRLTATTAEGEQTVSTLRIAPRFRPTAAPPDMDA